ncbi:MAG: M20/M25/M40 family metallo-hydrolase [Clostridiales bacterium]
MQKEALKKLVFADIEKNAQSHIDYLANMSRIPSEVFKPTYAQELVKSKMTDIGFDLDVFPCMTDEVKDLDDFHSFPGNYEFQADVENVVGVKPSKQANNGKSLMLIAHIDTEAVNNITPDTSVTVENNKMIGLGVADSKGGVAMMLLGAEAVLRQQPELEGSLTLLSSIGKRGAIGTLTAMKKGYHADVGVYLHPAETGHGFHEIKNFSMGMLDVNITVHGKAGVLFDELDHSEVSAIDKGCEVIEALRKFDAERQSKHTFKDGKLQGKPFTKVELFKANSSELVMGDCLRFDIAARVNFGYDETVGSVFNELQEYLKEYFRNDPWFSANPPEVSKGTFKGTPVQVAPESPVIKLIEGVVTEVKHFDDFIYQYHGSSEVRLPNLYGNTPTVGIGPVCYGLGTTNKESLDLADYIDGIKVVAGLIIDWCL